MFRLIALTLLLSPVFALAAPSLTWTASIDSTSTQPDRTRAVGMTSSGDVISVSQMNAGAQLTVKRHAAATGNATWSVNLNPATVEEATDLIVNAANGDSYVIGTSSATASGLDWYVVKLNGSDGTTAWTYTHSSSGAANDIPRAACLASDGNLIVAGMATEATSGLPRLRAAKINSGTGTAIWTYNHTSTSDAFDVAADTSGSVFAVGTKGADALVTKLSSAGALTWEQSLTGTGPSHWRAAAVLTTGDVVVAGGVREAAGAGNFFVARYPAAGGAATWSRSINGTAGQDDYAHDVAADASNNIYAVGMIRQSTGGQQAHAVRLAPANGTVTWSATRDGSGSAAEATDAFFAVKLFGTDILAAGTKANSSADIVISRFASADGAFQDDTIFNGASSNADTLLSSRLLAVNGTDFAIGGDSENATPSADGVVRLYANASLSVPGAPTIGTATAGNATASVAFTAPASNGGSPITSYTVTSNPGGITATGPASPISVTGLTNGTAYTFTVTATNAVGTGAASAPSNAVTPVTVPTVTTAAQSAVTSTSATLGGNVTADGGASVTERGIVWKTSSGPTTADNKVQNGSGTGAFSGTVTGLPAGTTVFVRAYAINSVNTSYGSEISFTTLSTNADLSALSTTAGSITFSAATTAYAVNVPNATTSTTVTATRAEANATLEVRINGGSYAALTSGSPSGALALNVGANPIDVRVTAQDGTTIKTYTITVTRAATVPGAPTIGTATAGNTNASVAFTAPTSDGGSPINSYTVTSSPGGLTGDRSRLAAQCHGPHQWHRLHLHRHCGERGGHRRGLGGFQCGDSHGPLLATHAICCEPRSGPYRRGHQRDPHWNQLHRRHRGHLWWQSGHRHHLQQRHQHHLHHACACRGRGQRRCHHTGGLQCRQHALQLCGHAGLGLGRRLAHGGCGQRCANDL
jgi:hypothetical protein